MSLQTFDRYESRVRSYCRSFPTVFEHAEGSRLYDSNGKPYLDFFAGAGVLNYGHNHPVLKQALLAYIIRKGISHSLDMATTAKADFLDAFQRHILAPRGMQYKLQFPGPTGTNCVEAALKLARKVKGREKVISFTNAFHGMTLGALAVSGNAFKRRSAGIGLSCAVSMPFCGYFGADVDTIRYMDRYLSDYGSGVDLPAAIIVETVQAEGGLNVADSDWLQRLAAVCRKHDLLLIVDDIQVGCGRTGSFFSFEEAGIQPDIVCLSKALSGYGLPLALLLIKPELDIWEPGEHNGTFRGHNLAFVTAAKTLELFWSNKHLTRDIAGKSRLLINGLKRIIGSQPAAHARLKGRGLILGLEFEHPQLATTAARIAFSHGLLIETSGSRNQVLKLLPPLTTDRAELRAGLEIIDVSLRQALGELQLIPYDAAAN